MKAMLLAAGLGTRLRPWTLSHPKALVPVEGIPMLERVLGKLAASGFDDITVNVHHFASQIVEFLRDNKFDANISVSDESAQLLDTGGGILHAAGRLGRDSEPFLVHNVDILSDANLSQLMNAHSRSDADVTLLVSGRESSRKLAFSHDGLLKGWVSSSGETKPSGFEMQPDYRLAAFSGIYTMNPSLFPLMRDEYGSNPFPIMDFFLSNLNNIRIRAHFVETLHLIDIGKPETLARASGLLNLIS